MAHQVLVYVGDHSDYFSWRKTAPEMPIMSHLDHTITTEEALKEAMAKVPLEAINNVLNETLRPVLKTMGISIFMDVQKANETPDDWMTAIKFGIQGLQTDHPKSLIDYLRVRKIRDRM